MLEAAIAEARARGYVGAPTGSDGYAPEITVHRGAGAYICGEETALLASLNGFRGQPSAKPPFPAVSGAFERPDAAQQRRDDRDDPGDPAPRARRPTTRSAPSRAAART